MSRNAFRQCEEDYLRELDEREQRKLERQLEQADFERELKRDEEALKQLEQSNG